MNISNDSCVHDDPTTVRLRSALGRSTETLQASVIALSLPSDGAPAGGAQCCQAVAVELALLHAELLTLLASTAPIGEGGEQDGGPRALSLLERELSPLEQLHVRPSRFTLDGNRVGTDRSEYDTRLVVLVERLSETGWCVMATSQLWDYENNRWAPGHEMRCAVDQRPFVRSLRVALAVGARRLEEIRSGLDGAHEEQGDDQAARSVGDPAAAAAR